MTLFTKVTGICSMNVGKLHGLVGNNSYTHYLYFFWRNWRNISKISQGLQNLTATCLLPRWSVNDLLCCFVRSDDSETEPVREATSKRRKEVDRTAATSRKKRTPWSARDLSLLKKTFEHLKKPPDNNSIRLLMDQEPSFRIRTIPQIKTRAWALNKSQKWKKS